jgi:MSHA biogenesis protein MshI
MMDVFSIFKQNTKSKGLISIQITPKGVIFVYSSAPKNPSKNICEFHRGADLKRFQKHLSQFVARNDLKKTDCVWILHPSYYRLLLIDMPQVPKNECKSAVSWQIKDMIDIPLEDLSVDIFPPAEDVIVQGKKLYVVAARRSYLQNVVDLLVDSKLRPVLINIHELAIANLLALSVKSQEKIMFLHVLDEISVFVIVKNNYIHFIHHIMCGLDQLLDDKAFNNFNTEIKRCFDYYQHQLEQNITNKLFLAPVLKSKEIITKNLAEVLGMEIQYIDINNLMFGFEPLTDELQATCCAAIGGALIEGR